MCAYVPTKVEYMCSLTSVSIHLYSYSAKHGIILMSLTPIQSHRVLPNPTFLVVCNLPLQWWEAWPALFPIHLLIFSAQGYVQSSLAVVNLCHHIMALILSLRSVPWAICLVFYHCQSNLIIKTLTVSSCMIRKTPFFFLT